jgi:uncharacterized lipoprotein YddW (UPF0748 family)
MSASQNHLMSLTNELRANWAETQSSWSDAKSREFEQRFIDPLIPAVNQAISNIESLERILGKIKSDCE